MSCVITVFRRRSPRLEYPARAFCSFLLPLIDTVLPFFDAFVPNLNFEI